MRAVWSFWTKPFAAHHAQAWLTGTHHLLAWVLSVGAAARHYPSTALVTDDEGARLLVDGLGLEFTSVSTGLNALDADDPAWWVLGKLWTYRAQREPFVHIDSDVFLWKPLPPRLSAAPVLAQNPERFPSTGDSWYRPAPCDAALRAAGGWLPEEWTWYTSRRISRAVCCGILGGNDTAFLSDYADRAMRMVRDPRNRRAWRALGGVVGDNILVEQYFLAACLEYRGVEIACLFPSADAAFDEAAASQAGYTHLIGAAKTNPALLARLERRVRREYPALFERCLAQAAPAPLEALA